MLLKKWDCAVTEEDVQIAQRQFECLSLLELPLVRWTCMRGLVF